MNKQTFKFFFNLWSHLQMDTVIKTFNNVEAKRHNLTLNYWRFVYQRETNQTKAR
jgi:hypothetical protein